MSRPPATVRSANAPRYDSLALHLTSGDASNHLSVATDLARRFKARLIGVGAQTFELPPLMGPETGFAGTRIIQDLEDLVQADLEKARAAFEAATSDLEAEWRMSRAAPAYALSRAARDADLIVSAPRADEASIGRRQADPADLVMASGRPVLVAPADQDRLEAKRIVLGWKDSREARRATSDALPFLQRAEDVLVQAVGETRAARADLQAEVAAVAANLARRGVRARGEVAVGDRFAAEQLESAAAALGADLIVAGAYGHNRTAEWAFGGVTHALLHAPRRFVLLSH